MKHSLALTAALALGLLPGALPAQQGTAPDAGPKEEMQDGFNLLDEGAKLLLRGLQEEMKPLMEDLAIEMEPKMRKFAEDLLPMLQGFSDIIGDLDQYHMPEKLPNGDIILRRKAPLEPELAEPEDEDGEVDI